MLKQRCTVQVMQASSLKTMMKKHAFISTNALIVIINIAYDTSRM